MRILNKALTSIKLLPACSTNRYNQFVRLTGLNSSLKGSTNCVLSASEQELLGVFKQQYNLRKQKPIQWAIKRSIDYTGASLGLVATSPIILLAGIILKLESKGPAIFKQMRIGKDGKEFVVYKLRTMYQGAPKTSYLPTSGKDANITKTGRILRKFSIDEFPQFVNMLKGDMSVIGPRPVQKWVLGDLIKSDPNAIRRLSVRPGAKLDYKILKDADLKDKIASEKKYLDNWNIGKDVKIFCSIIKEIITGRNY